MEFLGIFILSSCLWISQSLNDAQEKEKQEKDKQAKDKLKNEAHFNVRIIEKI